MAEGFVVGGDVQIARAEFEHALQQRQCSPSPSVHERPIQLRAALGWRVICTRENPPAWRFAGRETLVVFLAFVEAS
jgi:hypothetical protein